MEFIEAPFFGSWVLLVARQRAMGRGSTHPRQARIIEFHKSRTGNSGPVKSEVAVDGRKNVDSLNALFDDKCVFVHMGGTWGKSREIEVIRGGMIWYKKAEVYSVSVNMFGSTAILLNDLDLQAVVGGNEVTNAFMVTEVYIKEDGKWKMGSLTFSHLVRPVRMK